MSMNQSLLTALLVSIAAPALAQQTATTVPPLPATDPNIAALRDRVLTSDDYAFEITEGLTTEVGQRLAATEAEARARDWAVKHLAAMGFTNVHVEPFRMPVWTRGAEGAEILSPFPQKLAVTALGYSGSTGSAGVTGNVVYFESVDALRDAPDSAVRGKIVFIDHHMMPTQDGSGYGQFGAPRRPVQHSPRGKAPSPSSFGQSARIMIVAPTPEFSISPTARRLFRQGRFRSPIQISSCAF